MSDQTYDFHQTDDKNGLKKRQTNIEGDQTRQRHNIETGAYKNGHISPQNFL